MKYIFSIVFSLLSIVSYSQINLKTNPITMPLTVSDGISYISGYNFYPTTFGPVATREYGLQLSDQKKGNLSSIYFSPIDLRLDRVLDDGMIFEFTYDIVNKKVLTPNVGSGFVMTLFYDTQNTTLFGNYITAGAPDGALGFAQQMVPPSTPSASQINAVGQQKGYLGIGFDTSSEFKNLRLGSDYTNSKIKMKPGIPMGIQAAGFLNSPSTITVRAGFGSQTGTTEGTTVTGAGFAVMTSVATDMTTGNNFYNHTYSSAEANGGSYFTPSRQNFTNFSIRGNKLDPYPATPEYRRAQICYLVYGKTQNATNPASYFYSVNVLVGDTWQQVIPWTSAANPTNAGFWYQNIGAPYLTPGVNSPQIVRQSTMPYLGQATAYPLRVGFSATTNSTNGADIYVRNFSVTALDAPVVHDEIIDNVSLIYPFPQPTPPSYSMILAQDVQGYSGRTLLSGTTVTSAGGLSASNVDLSSIRILVLDPAGSGQFKVVSTPYNMVMDGVDVNGNAVTLDIGRIDYNLSTRELKFTAGNDISAVPSVSIGYDILGTNGVRSRAAHIKLNLVDNGYVADKDIVDYVKING